MDIVELGPHDAEVEAPRCTSRTASVHGLPGGPLIEQQIREVVEGMPGVEEVETELV